MLQAIYGLRSEQLFLEQMHYNLLCRWFAGLGADDPIWHHSSFSKNQERLLNEKMMALFLETLLGMEEVKPLLSNEHFSVDGTLLQAWASRASLKGLDGQFFGRTKATSEGRQKNQPAKQDFDRLTLANGYDERATAQQMVAVLTREHPRTIGADKVYDTKGLVALMRWQGVNLMLHRIPSSKGDRPLTSEPHAIWATANL